jgi:hypothetical protein
MLIIIMWKDFGIRVSKQGRLCFLDILDNIIKSADYNNFINKIDSWNKHFIGNQLYITKSAAMIIIMYANTRAAINFCRGFFHNFIDKYINIYSIVEQQNYRYDNFEFIYFQINDIKWFKAKDICIYLKYSNTKYCIIRHINKNNKLPFCELLDISFNNFIILFKKTYTDPQSIFINQFGLEQLLIRSDKVAAIEFAKHFNINVHQKITRKEIDIIKELDEFCNSSGINFVHPYSVKNKKSRYAIDCYLPDYKIAIEIDEFDHSNRDPKYEKQREKFLKRKLHCKFIRCNPDDPNFSISGLLGQIHFVILNI